MNLKFCLAVVCIGLSWGTMAQEIPLFDDSVPNLGRTAVPQNTIRLTPEGLPDISVSLNNERTISETTQKRGQLASEQPAPARRNPLKLSAPNTDNQTEEMSRRLNEEIKQYQAERAMAERKTPPQKTPLPTPKVEPKAIPQTMPESLTDLFGKLNDVHDFDISGIALGMTPEEVIEVAHENGYRITRGEYGIPLHRTSFYDRTCRSTGLYRVSEVQNCIIEAAKTDGVHYLSALTLSKPSTAEYIRVLFSTHTTGNVAYKIYYENKGDNSLNFSRKNLAKKIQRRDAFWKTVYDTYGLPDDKESLIWGDPQKAYLQAQMQGANYNAYLVLEDKEITDGDYAEAKEQKEALAPRGSFTFAAVPADED